MASFWPCFPFQPPFSGIFELDTTPNHALAQPCSGEVKKKKMMRKNRRKIEEK